MTQLETRPGVHYTPLIDGYLPFSKLLKDPFRVKIIEELHKQGITPTAEELNNFTKPKNRLKVNEGSKKHFKPMLGFEYFCWW